MTAVLFVGGSLVAGFVAGFVWAARDVFRNAPEAHRDELARNWHEGKEWGLAKGYAEGWTSGRIALVDEQEAKRHHPTGSPLSHLRALDVEADRQMGGDA